MSDGIWISEVANMLREFGYDPEQVASFSYEETNGGKYISNVRYRRPASVLEQPERMTVLGQSNDSLSLLDRARKAGQDRGSKLGSLNSQSDAYALGEAAIAAVRVVAARLWEERTVEEVEALHGQYREAMGESGFRARRARLKVHRLALAEELDPSNLRKAQSTVLEQGQDD